MRRAALLALLAFSLVGCGPGEDEAPPGASLGAVGSVEGALGSVGGCPCSGSAKCSEASYTDIPADNTYYITTFGSAPGETDMWQCGHRYTNGGNWAFIADAARFGGCAKVKIEANGKSCVALVADCGPNKCVEDAASFSNCNGHFPIIDASPFITKYLFGISSSGWSEKRKVKAYIVDESTAIGCPGGGGAAEETCTSHDHKGCVGNDVYWFDSCDKQEEKVSDCADSDLCTVDTCSAGSCKHDKMDCSAYVDRCHDASCKDGVCVQVQKPFVQEERCNGVDDNCDEKVDEGCDPDKDGWCTQKMVCDGPNDTCPSGCGDCNDAAAAINPGAGEACNGVDDDCDTVVDEGYADSDGEGLADCIDPDDDNDGVADTADNCRTTVNAAQVDTDKDGEGDACDLDDDGDGVADDGDASGSFNDRPCHSHQATNCDDNCRLVRNSAAELQTGLPKEVGDQSDVDADGLGDACDQDMDADGVPNAVDLCPRWPDPHQADSDGDAGAGGTVNWRHPGQGGEADPRWEAGGDACDLDDDNDGVLDDGDGSGVVGDRFCVTGQAAGCDDNCRVIANGGMIVAAGLDPLLGGQSDVDGDMLGDACDPDMDEDGIPNASDVCPRWPDPEQVDHDNDLAKAPGLTNLRYPGSGAGGEAGGRNITGGDRCDLDDDNDGVPDDGDDTGEGGDGPCASGEVAGCDDNCPYVRNSASTVDAPDPVLGSQSDVDGDGTGDACDPDIDEDAIPNEIDLCPRWPDPAQKDSDHDAAPFGASSNWLVPGLPGLGATDPRSSTGGDLCDIDDDDDGAMDDGDLTGVAGDFPCRSGGEDCDDNCRFLPNSSGRVAEGVDPLLGSQSDVDADGIGDACDDDMDDDGIPNAEDDCPRWADPGQVDSDADKVLGDGANLAYAGGGVGTGTGSGEGRAGLGGDACDLDDDNDEVPDAGMKDGKTTGIVCGKFVALECSDEANVATGEEDAPSPGAHPCGRWEDRECDDNCRTVPNGRAGAPDRSGSQADHDQDGRGDQCDIDDDEDGVPDDGDADGIAPTDFKTRTPRSLDCETGAVPEVPAPATPAGQCTAGIRSGCDDNCVFVRNPDQSDTDGDRNPEDDVWAHTPVYDGDEPCDFDDDDDGLSDQDEVLCGTDPKRWDSDGDGYSDFVELYPAGYASKGAVDYLDVFCCKGVAGEAERAACLETLRRAIAKEANARSCDGSAGTPPAREYATDPLWDKDLPAHHVPPGSSLSGGTCSAGRTAPAGESGGKGIGLLLAALALAVARRTKGVRSW